MNLKIKSELGAIQPQKENDIGGGYPVGEATKYRGRKKHSAYLQIIFKRNLNENWKTLFLASQVKEPEWRN